jgi:hypothetical protein
VTTSAFTLGPPPEDVSAWASSWTARVRPPHLGSAQVCVRAEREPHRFARILRTVTVVDLIPPSAVPGLAVRAVTSTSAKVTWGDATDNYGLAGYEIRVDGGTAIRTTVDTHSYSITNMSPATDHTVSLVAVDLAGNRSTTPATVSFTTPAVPPHNDVDIQPHEGYAIVSWHPDLDADVTYKSFLDGAALEDFPLDRYCQDANGNPASPCTEQDVISYPVPDLDESTLYAIQIQGVAANGSPSRELSGTFTTLTSPRVVPAATVALITSESSQCAGSGGSFYLSPNARGRAPVPAGSTQLFPGCYRVANSSCIDDFLPPSGNSVIKCADDITRLLYAAAPPGRGPVISSMEAVAQAIRAPALVPTPVLEPITWCLESPACITVVETAAEAVESVAIASTVEVVASFLVVAAEGIGLGIALFIILAILFPTDITIGSLFEYTSITPDTDFDTFDDWGGDHGDWYNSLKIYAEVIKTTKLLEQQDNIPIAWDIFKSQDLKATIDQACAAQRGHTYPPARGCDDDLVVYVPGGRNYRFEPMQETGKHIVDAMTTGLATNPLRAQWFYPARSVNGSAATAAGHSRFWYDREAQFIPNACTGRVAKTCDEFPFFATNQAVDLSGTVADLRPVPTTESLPQARDISGFYQQCDVDDGDHFIVLPVKPWVDAGGPSFGFRVNQGGASLCMPPRPPGT